MDLYNYWPYSQGQGDKYYSDPQDLYVIFVFLSEEDSNCICTKCKFITLLKEKVDGLKG